MNAVEKTAAKSRVREKAVARRSMPARNFLLNMLCATNTHADAVALLDRFERESETAERLSKVMDLCDEMERKGITSGEPFTVRRVHAIALGDDQRESSCICGEPATARTVHRTDGPCYVDDLPKEP